MKVALFLPALPVSALQRGWWKIINDGIYFKLVRGTAVQVSAARLDPKATAINDGYRKVQAT